MNERRERRRRYGMTVATITREQGFYFVRACNKLAGDHEYIARLFKTERAARMFCKREFLTIISGD